MPTVEYISRHIGTTQQKYTQRGGVRPFGLAMLLAGVDPDGKPQLWSTDPSGVYSAWKANAIGRNSKSLLEMLEKSYVDGCSTDDAVKLAVKALLEVVESGAKSIEIGIMRKGEGMTMMTEADISTVVEGIEAEKKAEAEAAGEEAARSASVTAGAGRM
jgi:20S proteasome alpha/beta subunit